MRISLPYDGDVLDIDLAGRKRVQVAGDSYPKPVNDIEQELSRALKRPVHSLPLEKRIPPEGTISILVSDMTRGSAVGQVLRSLLAYLEEHGVGPDRAEIIIATGMHRELKRSELKAHLGAEIFSRWQVLQHDAENRDLMIEVGTTASGTRCLFNERVVGAGLVIILGTLSFHYFAGFGGGRKLVLPGVAGEKTILANHRLSLAKNDRQTLADGCRPGNLEGNPVHEDMLEGARLLPAPLFAVNIVQGGGGGVAFLNAGDIELSHLAACTAYSEHFAIQLKRRYGAVIVSAGGSPWDANLLQAHKALRNASLALKQGGVMLAALSCGGGVGSPSFAAAFKGGRSGMLERVSKGYTLNTQTAISTYELTEQFSIYLRTMMEDEEVTRFGFCPWKEEYTGYLLEGIPDDEVLVIMNASGFLPACEEPASSEDGTTELPE
jgi:nickel-dependent lactate racemase